MTVYYNEWDPFAAQWLRNLIEAGELPAGDVDERSIRDVQPGDLEGYTSCHFFAGIGGWPLALRMAGWPDERPVWTGSCPCQPFSSAGKRKGLDDDRHLWPDLLRLLQECEPVTVMGEQVASKDGLAWLDLVSAELEDEDYTVRAADLCAAGAGAPHIRQRLFWVADTASTKRRANPAARHDGARSNPGREEAAGRYAVHRDLSGLGHSNSEQRERGGLQLQPRRPHEEGADACRDVSGSGMGDSNREPAGRNRGGVPRAQAQGNSQQLKPGRERDGSSDASEPSFWGNPDWVLCNDPGGARWRPVEPGSFPLAPRLPRGMGASRTGQLKAYGNAIVPQVAAEFIGAAMSVFREMEGSIALGEADDV